MRRATIALGVLAGCSSPYRAGALVEPTSLRQGAALGCLDVATSVGHELRAAPGSVVVTYAFGNHCDRAVSLDLRAPTVTARYADGAVLALARFDPRGEVAAGMLDGRAQGREVIEYQRAGRYVAGNVPVAACVDLAGITPEAPRATAARLCFEYDESRGAFQRSTPW